MRYKGKKKFLPIEMSDKESMMKKRNIYLWYLAIIILFFLSGNPICKANELFEVIPIFPENQINKSVNFFDLRMKPNQVEEIELEVRNLTNGPLDVYLRLETAVTSNEGKVVYRPALESIPFDKSLSNPFVDIAYLAKDHLELPPKGSQRASVIIGTPEKEFLGMILGGIRVTTNSQLSISTDTTNDTDLDDEAESVTSVVTDYLIAVRLTENDDFVPSGLSILEIVPEQDKNHNVFHLKLQNPNPAPLTNLHIEANIYRKNSSVLLHSLVDDALTMAPNSNMELSIPLGKYAFQAGNYTIIVNATSEEGEWEIEKEFKITRQDAKKYNDLSEDTLIYHQNWKNYIFIFVALIIAIIFVIFIVILFGNRKKRPLPGWEESAIKLLDKEKKVKKIQKNKMNEGDKEVKEVKEVKKIKKKKKKREHGG